MPVIKAHSGIITQINVFTVNDAAEQDVLIAHLADSAKVASDVPGWLSASLHKCNDGRRVVNYAQSESMDAAQRVIARLRESGMIDRNRLFGTAQPGLYDVVFTLDR